MRIVTLQIVIDHFLTYGGIFIRQNRLINFGVHVMRSMQAIRSSEQEI